MPSTADASFSALEITNGTPLPARLRTNRLLALLPADDAARLLPQLTPVQLAHGQTLHNVGEPIVYVYFPLNALISLVTPLADGMAVESAVVGKEGFAGLPLALGLDHDTVTAIVQVPGTALRMTAADFRRALSESGALREIAHRYVQSVIAHMAQSAACNRLHPMNERCARWLLETQDRVGTESFSLTQEFLAAMLGVRRATVTVAAGMLQQAGLITYRRGRVIILDRERLEAASCECYRAIVETTDRLLSDTALTHRYPPPVSPSARPYASGPTSRGDRGSINRRATLARSRTAPRQNGGWP